MDKIDIKIIQLHKQPFEGLKASKLVLEFSGKTMNTSLVNSLRRLSYYYVPTYAFCEDSINIEQSISNFNPDMMRLRLAQFTYPNFKNKIVHLPEKYWKNVNYGNPNREKFPDDKDNIEMYINASNSTAETIDVTTNHVKFYENGEEVIKTDQKYPCLIIKLRPNELFKCHARCVLGLGKRNDIWSAAGNTYYEQYDDDPNKFKFTIKSQGQMDEYEILHKSCSIMIKKLKDIKFFIGDKYKSTSVLQQKKVEIRLANEDHTLGNVINEYLQMNKNIAYSGLSKPDLLIDEVVIKILSMTNNPIKHVFETMDYLVEIYGVIQKEIQRLGSRYITYNK